MITALSTLWTSFVRTIVPPIVGIVLGWFTSQGMPVDPEFEAALTAALSLGFTAVYYLVVRLLETHVAPRFGWLLGSAKPPVYISPTVNGDTNQNEMIVSIPRAQLEGWPDTDPLTGADWRKLAESLPSSEASTALLSVADALDRKPWTDHQPPSDTGAH